MKKLILLIALIALQSCGTYCGAQKFRNSNKYYGTIINSHSGADVVSLWV
jgi:hypothetical protein